jgi:hypothetical protein
MIVHFTGPSKNRSTLRTLYRISSPLAPACQYGHTNCTAELLFFYRSHSCLDVLQQSLWEQIAESETPIVCSLRTVHKAHRLRQQHLTDIFPSAVAPPLRFYEHKTLPKGIHMKLSY